MDAFPTVSSLVLTVATTAFLLCYAAAIAIQVWTSRRAAGHFELVHVAYAVVAGLSGSALSFLASYFTFGQR